MTEATETANEVKIEEIGPAAKRLTITVTPDEISDKIESSLTTLAAETALPGFRKGRAPRKLLERRFGTAVRTETKNQIIADAYAKAIEEHKISPVGEPEPVEAMDDLEINDGEALTFSVDIEVMPEFSLPEFEGIEIKKPVLDISDEHVNEEIERYCLQLGEADRIEGDFEKGDRLAGPIKVSREGEDEPFFKEDQIVIVHPGDEDGGKGPVLGLLIDDLTGLLKGKKITDTVVMETVGPEGHEREDIRGKKLKLEFEIAQASRIEAATIDKVVETLGLGTEDILKEQVKSALEQRRNDEQADAMRQQVGDYLGESVDFELPEKLTARQIARTLEQQRLEMLYRGMAEEEVEKRLAEIRAESETGTRNRLKLFFVLNRLANEFKVEVTQQEINGQVAMLAARRGVRPEQLMGQLSESGQLNELATRIRENKALDRIVEKAKVADISPDDWREMQIKRGKAQRERTSGGGGSKKKTTTSKKSSSKKTSSKKTTTKKTTSSK